MKIIHYYGKGEARRPSTLAANEAAVSWTLGTGESAGICNVANGIKGRPTFIPGGGAYRVGRAAGLVFDYDARVWRKVPFFAKLAYVVRYHAYMHWTRRPWWCFRGQTVIGI